LPSQSRLWQSRLTTVV